MYKTVTICETLLMKQQLKNKGGVSPLSHVRLYYSLCQDGVLQRFLDYDSHHAGADGNWSSMAPRRLEKGVY